MLLLYAAALIVRVLVQANIENKTPRVSPELTPRACTTRIVPPTHSRAAVINKNASIVLLLKGVNFVNMEK